ncbi:cupredoxin domain-containing protein [Cyanobacteria bacterium FACHB-DQ100]|uniref:cupredoxin domain-containing protein n=1 Tax=Leptolyngbya sp. DQ-M1 TaxID=2933920 RepID=UPI0019942187|nr:cupredoxin domain-containing protein [Cyanobacteria bacterium FACHB-DQ100]
MLKKATFWGTLAGLGFLLGAISGAVAAEPRMSEMDNHPASDASQFQRIEQPLSNKVAVTLGGIGLIGLELWWFLLSKPKSRQAKAEGDIQEATITVDGGYEPSQIVVQAGQPVRLQFDRKDPSSCLEEVRFPDFRIAQSLPLNQTTAIEFLPNKPGRYEFTCGMNMFRGVVEAQSTDTATRNTPPSTSKQAYQLDQSVLHANQADYHAHHVPPSTESLEASMTKAGVQDVTVTVAKGYEPKRVIVEVGAPVRLHLQRINPSSCYDQFLIPAFDIAVDLELDTTTEVEFMPKQPGEYEFMCGMKMNRGVIEVRPRYSS